MKGFKVFRTCLLLVLAAVMAMSAVACTKSGKEKAQGTVEHAVRIGEGGVHEVSVVPTDKNMIANGASEYRIVIPEDASLLVQNAAAELQNVLALSTGVRLPIANDGDVQVGTKFVSIGETSLLAASDFTVDKNLLTTSGFRIVTEGDTVYLAGGGDYGVYYAATEFLYHTVGYAVYAADEIVYDSTDTVKLLNFNITEVPDFTYRIPYYASVRNDANFARRLRLNRDEDVLIPVEGEKWHNSFKFLPKETHMDAHREWYSLDGQQLCYLAQGNEAEADLMFEAFMKKFIEVVRANPDLDNITITQEDYNTWCTCDACVAHKAKYGTDSASVIQFCNRVSDAFEEYKAKNNYQRDIKIWFFAYQYTQAAPVTGTDGNFAPVDDSVVCRDNVSVFLAPIDADYSHSFYDEENTEIAETVKKWTVLSKEINLWVYSTCFKGYFQPFDNINSMHDAYVFYKNHNVAYLFDQAQFQNDPAPDWGSLKLWLNAKLMWNVNSDFEALIDEFFTGYFKTAAPAMRELFDRQRAHFAYLENVKGLKGLVNSSSDAQFTADMWPKELLDQFLRYTDEAYAAIEPLKSSDPELYDTLYDRICLETLTYRYTAIKLHANRMGSQELLTQKLSFKSDCMRLGITNEYESFGGRTDGSITNLWTAWGIG